MTVNHLNHSKLFLSLTLFCYSYCPSTSNASVIDFQNLVQADLDLSHQFTFDGQNDQERLEDKVGDANLTPRPFGSGAANDIEYGKIGYDETSNAISTSRGPGNDFAQGAGLHNASVSLNEQLSFEIIFQPNSDEITGGNFNLGYILNTRVNNDRGYFLVQGNAPLPSTGQQLSSTIGDGFAERNQNLILSQIEIGHWYFVAGSYSINQDTNTTTFTNYIADLTAGDTILKKIGPFSNNGGPYPTGVSPLGIGGRWDAGESFPGQIDEVNLYNVAKDGSDFQQHLDAITGGKTPFEINKITHDINSNTITIEWNSISGKAYAVDASSDMIEWNELDDGLIGEKDLTSFTDTELLENTRNRFYRVREIEE